jgi:hypothetical protein
VKIARPDDDNGYRNRESWPMNSPATSIAYISADLPDGLTLSEYGRLRAAQSSTGESRLKRALHGLRFGNGALRRPTPRFA